MRLPQHRDNLAGYFQDYHFWVRSVAKHPQDIYADRRWAFWQYTSTGVVPGIRGQTDINVFAGTEQNWKKWVASVSKCRMSSGTAGARPETAPRRLLPRRTRACGPPLPRFGQNLFRYHVHRNPWGSPHVRP